MEHNEIAKSGLAVAETSLRRRFLTKVVMDVLPAALTSVIGGFLVTQYQFNHAPALHPATEQATSASPEMVQLVRDEHVAIMDYLKAQIAAEKASNLAANAADARAVAEARTAADKAAADKLASQVLALTSSNTAPVVSAAEPNTAARPVTPRKVVMAAVVVTAPREQGTNTQMVSAPAASAVAVSQPAPAPQPQRSLLARTIDIKDHVVAATSHAAWTAVSTISSLPSWIASMGGRGGDTQTAPGSAGQSFTS